MPDYNWLSFAITQTPLLKRQLPIRITFWRQRPLRIFLLLLGGKQSFALSNQTKHITCHFFWRHGSAQYYKMTTLKKSKRMSSKPRGSNVIKCWRLEKYSHKDDDLGTVQSWNYGMKGPDRTRFNYRSWCLLAVSYWATYWDLGFSSLNWKYDNARGCCRTSERMSSIQHKACNVISFKSI